MYNTFCKLVTGFGSLVHRKNMFLARRKKLTGQRLLAEKKILAWQRESQVRNFRTFAALTILFPWALCIEIANFGRIVSTLGKFKEYLFVTKKRNYYQNLLYPLVNGYVTENPLLNKTYKKVIQTPMEIPVLVPAEVTKKYNSTEATFMKSRPHSRHKKIVMFEHLSASNNTTEASVIASYLSGDNHLLDSIERNLF